MDGFEARKSPGRCGSGLLGRVLRSWRVSAITVPVSTLKKRLDFDAIVVVVRYGLIELYIAPSLLNPTED